MTTPHAFILGVSIAFWVALVVCALVGRQLLGTTIFLFRLLLVDRVFHVFIAHGSKEAAQWGRGTGHACYGLVLCDLYADAEDFYGYQFYR